MVYISTDCADDLSLRTSNEVRFEKPSVEACSPRPRALQHEHAWFVGSESGCSCTFRHLCRESVKLGFGAPEDWFPEEEGRVAATRRLYQILKEIVERGYRVEVLDCWSGDEDKEPERRDVSLSQVPADHFRLFEGYLFTPTP